MRIAVSGSHGTGKSTLLAEFLARCPAYRLEPEAYELLADDVELTPSEGPTVDGLGVLLEHTLARLEIYEPGARVVFERSPVDYLAYAAASRSWPDEERRHFLRTSVPRVRASLVRLDLIAVVPLSPASPPPRAGESRRFRKRVAEALDRALLDDRYRLFEGKDLPRVVHLPARPDAQVAALVRLAGSATGLMPTRGVPPEPERQPPGRVGPARGDAFRARPARGARSRG